MKDQCGRSQLLTIRSASEKSGKKTARRTHTYSEIRIRNEEER